MHIVFSIPDVTTDPIRPDRILRLVIQNVGPTNFQDLAILNNLIRLSENAASEYTQGTISIREFWEQTNLLNMRAATNSATQFEACVTSVFRAMNHIRAIRKRSHILSKSKRMLPSSLSIYTPALHDQVRKLRNEIQHSDESILKGKIVQSQFYLALATGTDVPTPDGNSVQTIDRVEIGALEISFATLSRAIQELRSCCEALAEGEYGPST